MRGEGGIVGGGVVTQLAGQFGAVGFGAIHLQKQVIGLRGSGVDAAPIGEKTAHALPAFRQRPGALGAAQGGCFLVILQVRFRPFVFGEAFGTWGGIAAGAIARADVCRWIVEVEARFKFGEPLEVMVVLARMGKELEEHHVLEARVRPVFDQIGKAFLPAFVFDEPRHVQTETGAGGEQPDTLFGEEVIARALARGDVAFGDRTFSYFAGCVSGRGVSCDEVSALQVGKATAHVLGGVSDDEG